MAVWCFKCFQLTKMLNKKLQYEKGPCLASVIYAKLPIVAASVKKNWFNNLLIKIDHIFVEDYLRLFLYLLVIYLLIYLFIYL